MYTELSIPKTVKPTEKQVSFAIEYLKKANKGLELYDFSVKIKGSIEVSAFSDDKGKPRIVYTIFKKELADV